MQHYLNYSDQVTSLDFSHSLIKGELLSSRLGISIILSPETSPKNLTISEQKIIESNNRFSPQPLDNINSIILFRGALKFNESILTEKMSF